MPCDLSQTPRLDVVLFSIASHTYLSYFFLLSFVYHVLYLPHGPAHLNMYNFGPSCDHVIVYLLEYISKADE